jgi:membrane-associated phospholipid phosphatase
LNPKLLIFFLITIALAFISYFYIDLAVATYFNGMKGSDLREYFGVITDAGKSEYYLVPAALAYLFYKNKDSLKASKAGFLFASVALSGILVLIIKMFLGRFRPEMYFKHGNFGFDFFEVTQNMLSFPSGHSATAFSVAVAFGFLFKRYQFLFYTVAVLIVTSRVVITRHYVSDVLVGSLIGIIMTLYLYEKYYKKKLEG